MSKKIPKCPNCQKELTEVYEYGSFRKDWIWNEETKKYDGNKEKWQDDITCHCGNCGEEIDNTFLLDHTGENEKGATI